jgi:SAM-dependent methyltransferase
VAGLSLELTMSPAADSTTRFSNRVADYVRYRPSYPDQLIQTLQAEAGLTPQSIVADVGSGTGISVDLFLRLGCTVFGIEPNADSATAEATSLPNASVDLVAVGQAFHWFDRDRTRAEFSRILRPNGSVALFWNSRRTESTPFLKAYEALLNEFATDYQQINHTNIDKTVIAQFFAGKPFEIRSFPSFQDFDFDGLRGRLLSSSYAPAAGQPRHEAMLLELERLYRDHQSDGKVRFEYDTELYFGRLN